MNIKLHKIRRQCWPALSRNACISLTSKETAEKVKIASDERTRLKSRAQRAKAGTVKRSNQHFLALYANELFS